MKKLIFVLTSLTLGAGAAWADYATVECASAAGVVRQVKLSLDEISDVQADTASLEANGRTVRVSRVGVSQTVYGLLGLNVQGGNGPGKYNYIFQNLGSSDCFGVYKSEQKGPATVDVVNSLGKIGSLSCECSVD